MKNTIIKILGSLSVKIIKKYKPKVIGITGSIGKTSTKEAVFVVLSEKFDKVRASEKNYNNELGVPLTIIGSKSANKSFIGWLGIIFKGIFLLLIKDSDYPKYLILEMAADKPGDIRYLTEIIPCDIGILTNIGPVHLEKFKTIEKVGREKKQIITHLKKDDIAVLNHDEERVIALKDSTKAKVITYGFNEQSDVRAIELETAGNGINIDGIKFKLVYKGSAVPIFMPKVIGKNSILAALAAAAVGVNFDMNLVEISEGLKKYKSPKGRMNIIEGIKHTMLIDDTYNSSPESAQAALEVLKKIQIQNGAKKFAVLGNMLELGAYTEEAHEKIGQLVAEFGIDVLITVGDDGLLIAKAAKYKGMSPDRIFTFDYSEEAGRFLQDRMKQGDVILIKGSQGVRMEKIVKEVMADPLRAKELLVRQDEEWKNK